MEITALAGGVGASKLLLGLAQAGAEGGLTVVVNTGDDIILHGLRISPDLDIVTYTLAGLVNPKTGWGFRGDTFAALERLCAYDCEAWFHLGDRDLATHIHRTAMLLSGASLSEVTEQIRQALRVKARILPMSDQFVPTYLDTSEGPLHFQEYLVKRGAEPVVRAVQFRGVENASPAPGVLKAIDKAEAILICPSNPLISISPILAVPGIRDALRRRRADVFAVSPIIGGKSLKGPSDKMLAQLGREVSARSVAALYSDFAGTFILDPLDEKDVPVIKALGMRAEVRSTVMRTDGQKVALARAILRMMSPRRRAAGA